MNPPDHQAAAALDAQALARLRELDPDGRLGVVNRVLAAFETSLTRMITQLESEREGGNAGVVAGVAHTLKSSSASVGALALAQACADVEAKLRKGDSAEMHLDILRLISEGQAALRLVGAILHP